MLDDYEPVAVRLDRWYQIEIAAGRIPRVLTTLLSAPGADVCVFRAELWRITQLADGAGERATLLASGHAEEVRGSNHITKTSHLEVAETSAIGRALANWNQISHATLNGRPSREEMQKATTSNPAPAQPRPQWKQDRADADIARGDFQAEMDMKRRSPMTGAASEKQIGYIKGACKRDGIPAPLWVEGLTKQQASDWIEQHKEGIPAQRICQNMQPQVQEEDPF
jgi:hypothetical protein